MMSNLISKVGLVSGVVVLGVLLAATTQAASVGTLKEFRTPSENSGPRHIVQGSDGNMWFTGGPNADLDDFVARVTPRGEITEFAVCDSCGPNDIAQGPDGILYFTNNDVLLGRISTAGEVLPGVSAGVFVGGNSLAIHNGIAWITDFNRNVLWRYDITADILTSIDLPTANALPGDIAVTSFGEVWFTQGNPVPSLTSYNPGTGVFDTIALPEGMAQSIAVNIDNSIWFTQPIGDKIGVHFPGTSQIDLFPVGDGARPSEIAVDGRGSVWFTQDAAGNMARLSPVGQITAETKQTSERPLGIAVAGLGGDPWYVDNGFDSAVVTLRLK
jgi:virginiamycin B lyase